MQWFDMPGNRMVGITRLRENGLAMKLNKAPAKTLSERNVVSFICTVGFEPKAKEISISRFVAPFPMSMQVLLPISQFIIHHENPIPFAEKKN
jgi:hypothetical protein